MKNTDLSGFSLDDLILSALRSEIDSKEVYSKLADGVKNFLLKDRLKFLAEEEEKHRDLFEALFKEKFPDKDLVIPEKTPVPLPEIKIADENVQISDVLESAMEAEKAAHDFYVSLADRLSEDSAVSKMLKYIASMEMGHYKLLEIEKRNALEFEYFDQTWPMMHVGP